jgi:hypothetical protein
MTVAVRVVPVVLAAISRTLSFDDMGDKRMAGIKFMVGKSKSAAICVNCTLTTFCIVKIPIGGAVGLRSYRSTGQC